MRYRRVKGPSRRLFLRAAEDTATKQRKRVCKGETFRGNQTGLKPWEKVPGFLSRKRDHRGTKDARSQGGGKKKVLDDGPRTKKKNRSRRYCYNSM